jgi:hypothetical protein
MPVGSRNPRLNGTGHNSFGPANTTSFLFDEDDDRLNTVDLTSPIAKAFAQLEGDDTFPTLTSDGLKVSLVLSPTLFQHSLNLPALCQFSCSGSSEFKDSGS